MIRFAVGRVAAAMIIAMSLLACGSSDQRERTMMQAGFDDLTDRHDPVMAAIQFREVLKLDSTNYVAALQLGLALRAAGRLDEVRPILALALTPGVFSAPSSKVSR